MTISFTVLGDPVSSLRPRFSRRGGRVRTHMPKKSTAYKEVVRAHMMKVAREEVVRTLDGPRSVRIDCFFARPKSDARKRNPREIEKRTKKPDVDNLAKLILDAGTGIFWRDDAQVTHCDVAKYDAAQGLDGWIFVQIDF